MLILTRRVGQSILIGDSIKLTIKSSGKTKVKISVDAPRDITVYREEIYRRIATETKKDPLQSLS